MFLKTRKRVDGDSLEKEIIAILAFRFKNFINLKRHQNIFMVGLLSCKEYCVDIQIKNPYCIQFTSLPSEEWTTWMYSVIMNELGIAFSGSFTNDYKSSDKNNVYFPNSKKSHSFRDFIYGRYSSYSPEEKYRSITIMLPKQLQECV